MSMKGWGAAAAVVLVLGLGAVWTATSSDRASSEAPVAPLATDAPRDPAPREHTAPAEEWLPPPVDLDRCDRDLDLHGVVVRADGAPIAGARVETSEFPWQRTSLLNVEQGYEPVVGPSARAASDGTFSLRLRRGQQVHLVVTAPGCAPAELAGCQSGERVRVVLGPGARLRFQCRDEAGAPVVGANVSLTPFHPTRRLPAAKRRSAVSGDAGDCVFDGLAPGSTIFVMGHHPRRAWADGVWLLPAPERDEAVHTLHFVQGRTLRGRVTDAATGAAVKGARLATSWTFDAFSTSDADGRFELTESALASFGLWVRAKGFAEEYVSLTEAESYDVALSRGDRVEGRLVGPDAKPVAGALVAVTSHGGGGSDRAQHTVTDADGRFLVADLRHDQPHALTFLAEGFGRTLLDVDPAPTAGGAIALGDIVLPAARTLEGRVLAADGTPVPGTTLRLYGFNEDRGRLRPEKGFVSTHYGCREERRCDDLGRFRFPDLAPGDYDLEAITEDVRIATTTVALPADRDVTGVELRLPDGARFVVHARDDAGAPAAGVTVSVATKSGWSGQVTTLADGVATFVLPSPPVSVGAFSWTKSLLPAPRRRVEESASSADLVLRRARGVRGQIVDPEGRSFQPSAPLAVFESGRPVPLDPWDQNTLGVANDGAFEVAVPLDGAVDLDLGPSETPDGRLVEGALRGIRADASDVVLRTHDVTLDRELSVLVRGPSGRAEAGVEVVARFTSKRSATATTAADGRARLTGLPATPAAVEVTLPAGHPHRTDWIVDRRTGVRPDAGEIEFLFETGRRVAGVARAPDGTALAGANVWLYRGPQAFGQPPFARAETGADGRFAVAAPRGEGKSLYLFIWKNVGDVQWTARRDGLEEGDLELDLTLRVEGR